MAADRGVMRTSILCSAAFLLMITGLVAPDAHAAGAGSTSQAKRAAANKKKGPKRAPAPEPLPAPTPIETTPQPDAPAATPPGSNTTTAAPIVALAAPAASANADVPGPRVPTKTSHHLKPLQLDLHANASTDILLAYIGVGATADLGLVPAGPGTLAVGAGFEYDFCASVCWLLNAATPFRFSQSEIAPSIRATYHLDLKHKNLDVYPIVFAGPVFARSTIELKDSSASYIGKDTGFQVGVGVGLSYFVADRFSIGLEGRYRHARGTYTYELNDGNGRTFDGGSGSTWSLSGLNVVLALGFRL
jgi:hypothetical protein